jgi:hypothetical protein
MKVESLVKHGDGDPLILAVGSHVVHIVEQARDAVGRNACSAQKRPSDPNGSIVGTTGSPGQRVAAILDTLSSIAGSTRESDPEIRFVLGVTMTLSSAMTVRIVRITASGASSGSILQLMVAFAVWGKALPACPPSSRVAVHVVRITAL